MAKSSAQRASSIASTMAIMGPDPADSPDRFTGSSSELIRAINWYRYYFEEEDVKRWLDPYVAERMPSLYQKFKTVPSSSFKFADGVIARLLTAGCHISIDVIDRLDATLTSTIESYVPPVREKKEEPSVHEDNELIGEIDSWLDQLYLAEFKYFEPELYNFLKEKAAKPSQVKEIIPYYESLLEEVLERTDLTKKQQAAYVKFVARILEDAAIYVKNTKKERRQRKPRAKKVKSADQLAANAKFLKEYPPLKLVSLLPSEIVKAEVVYLFNPKYNKLTRLVAEKDKQLSIHRTSVTNYDEKNSSAKRLRKPEQFFTEVREATKAGYKRAFNELKTVESTAGARLSDDIIILKVFK